jgi:hypothetical protein
MDAIEKEDMRDLALRGGLHTAEERSALLNYCEKDVEALCRLLTEMLPIVDLPRALLRGRYMKAAARIEHYGIPLDTGLYQRLRDRWPDIQEELIHKVDSQYCVYEGRCFKLDRFEAYLSREGIAWPRTQTGRLALDDDTFRGMALAYPEIVTLRELRVSLSKMRLENLSVGSDGRNRTLLSPFRSRTGRNQPSTNRFIFGPAKWLRGLIRPRQGSGLAYIDWEQQEFGIAAALSEDPAMKEAYRSGDPYLSFAKQASVVPLDATKATHPTERELVKDCVLGIQYGMGAQSLAQRIGRSEIEARELLRKHHQTFPVFWRWSQATKDYGNLYGKIWTVFGWEIRVGAEANPRFLLNFPMQANGAEMLRLACCLATERGVRVCAPIHDALLIEAPLEELDDSIAETEKAMVEASSAVLDGFELRTDRKIIRYPDRYKDRRGEEMWNTVMRILEELG